MSRLSCPFKNYAKYYDIIYSDKDYKKECNFLEDIFARYSRIKPKFILDGGCGTGGHSIELAKRGYEVVGVDRSREMINIAAKKAKDANVKVEFKVMDLRTLNLGKKFDVCICMFAVLSYLASTKDILMALRNTKIHLRSGGLFIFDFWYGPAVLSIEPSTRVKIVETDKIKVIRFVTPEVDTFRHIVKSHYYLIAMEGGRVVEELRETHVLRYFFAQELIHYLEESGFEVLRFCAFANLDEEPRSDTWNVAVVARAF